MTEMSKVRSSTHEIWVETWRRDLAKGELVITLATTGDVQEIVDLAASAVQEWNMGKKTVVRYPAAKQELLCWEHYIGDEPDVFLHLPGWSKRMKKEIVLRMSAEDYKRSLSAGKLSGRCNSLTSRIPLPR